MPLVGWKESTTGGGGVTTKSCALWTVPEGFVTSIFPVMAPDGTVARI